MAAWTHNTAALDGLSYKGVAAIMPEITRSLQRRYAALNATGAGPNPPDIGPLLAATYPCEQSDCEGIPLAGGGSFDAWLIGCQGVIDALVTETPTTKRCYCKSDGTAYTVASLHQAAHGANAFADFENMRLDIGRYTALYQIMKCIELLDLFKRECDYYAPLLPSEAITGVSVHYNAGLEGTLADAYNQMGTTQQDEGGRYYLIGHEFYWFMYGAIGPYFRYYIRTRFWQLALNPWQYHIDDEIADYAGDATPGHQLIFTKYDTTTNSDKGDKTIRTYGGAVDWTNPPDYENDFPGSGGSLICSVDAASGTEETETLPESYLPTSSPSRFYTRPTATTQELTEPDPLGEYYEGFGIEAMTVKVFYRIKAAFCPTG